MPQLAVSNSHDSDSCCPFMPACCGWCQPSGDIQGRWRSVDTMKTRASRNYRPSPSALARTRKWRVTTHVRFDWGASRDLRTVAGKGRCKKHHPENRSGRNGAFLPHPSVTPRAGDFGAKTDDADGSKPMTFHVKCHQFERQSLHQNADKAAIASFAEGDGSRDT